MQKLDVEVSRISMFHAIVVYYREYETAEHLLRMTFV